MRFTKYDIRPLAERARILLPWLALSLLAACSQRDDHPAAGQASRTAIASPSELVYVSNEDSQNLTVIDAATDSVVATIPVGLRARGVRVGADGRTVYVALSGSPKCPPTMSDAARAQQESDRSKDGIAVIDVASRKTIKVLPAGLDPETFDVSRDGTRLFVSNEDADSLTIVDLATGRTTASVKVGREPEGVTVSPDGKSVWVTGETDNDITVVDVAAGRVIGQIDTRGKRPRSIGFLPDGTKAYVTNESSGTVSVIDARTLAVRSVITMPAGSRPMGIVITSDGTRVYISNGRGGTVARLDPAGDSVITTLPVGKRPWGIGLTRDGTELYTANDPENDVTVVNTGTMTVLRTTAAGSSPWGVAVGPKP